MQVSSLIFDQDPVFLNCYDVTLLGPSSEHLFQNVNLGRDQMDFGWVNA